MAKLGVKVLLLVTAFALVSPCLFAASSTSGPILIEAGIDGTLGLTVVLKKNNYAGAEVISMDFGRLIDIGTGSLRSSPTSTTGTGAIAAFIYVTSFEAKPYTVTQTCNQALSNGVTTLPSGACTVVPLYEPGDNGGALIPAGAQVGIKGSWVETNKMLFYSGAAGLSRCVTAYYSITDDPAAGASTGVPLNQAGGNYEGSITISVTQ